MENQDPKLQRPVFLTIICIFSFVGLGWSVIQSLFGLAFSTAGNSIFGLASQNLERAFHEAEISDPAAAAMVSNIFEAILKLLEVLPMFLGILTILSLVALTGVIMMWNLKKTGFYFYSAAKLIIIFLPVLFIGYNLVSAMMTIAYTFGAAIFITLYALNFKSLK